MWALSFKSHSLPSQKRNGFTIVELLIVVVVIAILAAITIVAYNGIQNRAKMSAVQQAVNQANKKVLSYAVVNADQYPADLETAGITNDSTTYQYSVNNTASPKTFCITATNGTFSYYISNAATNPQPGACPGQSNGGAELITNLATNTTFKTAATGVGASGTGGQSSFNAIVPTGGPTNGPFYRRSYSAASTSFGNGSDIITMGGSYSGGVAPASPGQVFTASAYVRSSKAQIVRSQIQFLNSMSTGAGAKAGNDISLLPNVWTRVSVTSDPASSTAVSVRVDLDGGVGPVQWANNDTIDYTMIMLTSGSTLYNFADGDSSGWAWTGAANASTSIGSPIN